MPLRLCILPSIQVHLYALSHLCMKGRISLGNRPFLTFSLSYLPKNLLALEHLNRTYCSVFISRNPTSPYLCHLCPFRCRIGIYNNRSNSRYNKRRINHYENQQNQKTDRLCVCSISLPDRMRKRSTCFKTARDLNSTDDRITRNGYHCHE